MSFVRQKFHDPTFPSTSSVPLPSPRDLLFAPFLKFYSFVRLLRFPFPLLSPPLDIPWPSFPPLSPTPSLPSLLSFPSFSLLFLLASYPALNGFESSQRLEVPLSLISCFLLEGDRVDPEGSLLPLSSLALENLEGRQPIFLVGWACVCVKLAVGEVVLWWWDGGMGKLRIYGGCVVVFG